MKRIIVAIVFTMMSKTESASVLNYSRLIPSLKGEDEVVTSSQKSHPFISIDTKLSQQSQTQQNIPSQEQQTQSQTQNIPSQTQNNSSQQTQNIPSQNNSPLSAVDTLKMAFACVKPDTVDIKQTLPKLIIASLEKKINRGKESMSYLLENNCNCFGKEAIYKAKQDKAAKLFQEYLVARDDVELMEEEMMVMEPDGSVKVPFRKLMETIDVVHHDQNRLNDVIKFGGITYPLTELLRQRGDNTQSWLLTIPDQQKLFDELIKNIEWKMYSNNPFFLDRLETEFQDLKRLTVYFHNNKAVPKWFVHKYKHVLKLDPTTL